MKEKIPVVRLLRHFNDDGSGIVAITQSKEIADVLAETLNAKPDDIHQYGQFIAVEMDSADVADALMRYIFT